MTRRSWMRSVSLGAAGASAVLSAPPPLPGGIAWTQWGGPNRNFQTEASGLKDEWPAEGPRVVWKRSLGEGYSSPSVEGNVLYTMYGRPTAEFVTAIDASTGKTLWEQESDMRFRSDAPEMGNGPYATPLVAADRIFTTSVAGRLQALDKKSGKVLWRKLFGPEFQANHLMYGYASSPIAFRELVIVPVGGKGHSIMAFRQQDGAVAWARHDFPNAYSSPLLVEVDGLAQLVQIMDGALIAVNPLNGDMQWQVPFRADYGISVSTPVWGPGNLLFVSAEYGAGSKVIELKRDGNGVKATELWNSNRLRLHHGNAMCLEGTLYFSSGGKGSQAILSAVEMRTGKVYWQERSISKATFVWADRKLITLDQDGNLMIAHPSAQGFKVAAKAALLTNLSWTPPVLVGPRLYIRDRHTLMSVDLS